MAIEPLEEAATQQDSPSERTDLGSEDANVESKEPDAASEEIEAGSNGDDITAELARLFEERTHSQPMDEAVVGPPRKRPRRKAE